jgi:hypothetical protein
MSERTKLFATVAFLSATSATGGLACSASTTGASGGGDSGSTNGSSSATDQLTVQAGAQTYTYQCAEQPLDETAGPRIVTTGCGWPSGNPRIEIDFAIQGGQPLQNVTIDLSSSLAPSSILFTVGLSEQSNLNNVSIYPAFQSGGAGVAAGTSGLVDVRSYDPASGKMDVVATNVVLPVSMFNSYPGAPSTVTVESAEIVR